MARDSSSLLQAHGRLRGTRAAANFQTGAIDAQKLELEARLPNPKGPKGQTAAALPLAANGSLAVKTGSAPRLDAKLTGQFDASRFTHALGMPRFSPAAYTIAISPPASSTTP